jgi:putative membrane protein
MQSFLIRWLITSIAVLAAKYVVPGIDVDNTGALLIAALFLGLFNAVLKPLLMLVTLPLLLLSFGLFTLVINSFLLLLVSQLVHGFHVAGWWSAFWGSLIISIVTMLLRPNQSPPSNPQGPSRKTFVGKDKIIDV